MSDGITEARKGTYFSSKKLIPTDDPQTGELNPYYKELTGKENPLDIKHMPNQKLHKVASMIADNEHTPTINQVIDELVNDENSYPSDEKLRLVLKTLKVSSNLISVPLLEMLEGDEDNGKISGPDVSVEHIMPQNSKKWIEYIISKHGYLENVPDGDEHDEARIKAQKDANEKAKSMHSKYLSWLGNQTLLSIPLNSKIKNDSFEIKKSHYKNG